MNGLAKQRGGVADAHNVVVELVESHPGVVTYALFPNNQGGKFNVGATTT